MLGLRGTKLPSVFTEDQLKAVLLHSAVVNFWNSLPQEA